MFLKRGEGLRRLIIIKISCRRCVLIVTIREFKLNFFATGVDEIEKDLAISNQTVLISLKNTKTKVIIFYFRYLI